MLANGGRVLTIAAYMLHVTSGLIEPCTGRACKHGVNDVIVWVKSYTACTDECKARSMCQGVSYHALTRVCKIHGQAAVTMAPVDCTGFVYSDRSTWQEASFMCEDSRCDQEKAVCVAGQLCRYPDCSHTIPTVSNLVISGNALTTGSKLALRCVAPFVLIGERSLSCLASGQWSDPFPSCGPGVIPEVSTAPPTTTEAATSTSLPPPPITTNALICDAGWTINQGRCYYIVNEYKDYAATKLFDGDMIVAMGKTFMLQSDCSVFGGHIATPNTATENAFIKSMFSGAYSYWIGIDLVVANNQWATTDDGNFLTYGGDWFSGTTPTDAARPCAIYRNTFLYQWDDEDCAVYANVICEKPGQ